MANRVESITTYLVESLPEGSFQQLRRALQLRRGFVLITGNEGKARETEQILTSLGFNWNIENRNFPGGRLPEIQGRLYEVSGEKAKAAYRRSGEILKQVDMRPDGILLPLFVEDTGFDVDSMEFPGPFIKWMFEGVKDEEGCRRIVEAWGGKPVAARTVFATSIDGENALLFEGTISGRIPTEVMPGQFGFGWDAAFVPDGFNASFAQMSSQMKNQISMRARAIEKIARFAYPSQ